MSSPEQPAPLPAMRARRATWRMGLRERMRLQWLVVAIICILLFMGLKPWYIGMVDTRNLETCTDHTRRLAQALAMYQNDWGEALPPGERWQSSLRGYLPSTTGTGFSVDSYFKCPLDKSGSPSSFTYNSLLEGLNLDEHSLNPEKEARLSKLRRPKSCPLLIEKHGSPLDSHVTLHNWDEVLKAMSFPHSETDPSGLMVTGGGKPERLSRERLQSDLSGKGF